MAQSTPVRRTFDPAFHADFAIECERLFQNEHARGGAEAILRLRALADISSLLSTAGLVELAAAVAVTRSAVRTGGRTRRRSADADAPLPEGSGPTVGG